MSGNTWEQQMRRLCIVNGLDPTRVVTLPIVPHEQLRRVYEQTDVGLFTNRCEGGTNLVMMEYMACARPVIATYATGHVDMINEHNAILLRNNIERTYELVPGLFADWVEPSVEESLESLEFAYDHRDELGMLGTQAGAQMAKYSWERCAQEAIELMGLRGPQ
jgi:glycosyltransferase involved in cell wall biosynthesis